MEGLFQFFKVRLVPLKLGFDFGELIVKEGLI